MSAITNLELLKKHMTAMHDPRIYEDNAHPSADDILECIAPTWVVNRPAKDGWYLFRETAFDDPEPVLVSQNQTKVGVFDFENVDDIRDYHGEWCYLEELADL